MHGGACVREKGVWLVIPLHRCRQREAGDLGRDSGKIARKSAQDNTNEVTSVNLCKHAEAEQMQ